MNIRNGKINAFTPILLFLLALLLTPAAATAQTATSFSGRVDSTGTGTGTPVPGATVTLTDSRGVRIGTLLTDGDGRYSFTGLPAGFYEVVAAKQGFTFNPTSRGCNTQLQPCSDQNFQATKTGAEAEGLQYYALPRPVRLLDTRPGQQACFTPGSPLQAGASLTQPAALTCDGVQIPSTARAVVGNATVVNTTPAAASGFVTLYPSGSQRPTASNLNYVPGLIVPNSFTVSLGPAGSFEIFAFSETHFVVDITGYYAPPGEGGLFYHPLPRPVRLLDTRPGQTACFAPGAPLAGGATLTQTARTTCDGIVIPDEAMALVGNATVVNTTPSAAPGFITLHPSGSQRPVASNLNYVPGQIVPNSFTVGLGASGSFDVFAFSETHFIVDVTGYYSSSAVADSNGMEGLLYYGLPAPVRLLETRPGEQACFNTGSPLVGGLGYVQQVTGVCSGQAIPPTARAVAGNATVVNTVAGAGSGFVTLYPSGEARPVASNLNYVPGQIVPNSFVVRLGDDGRFVIFPLTETHFIVDLTGYFTLP